MVEQIRVEDMSRATERARAMTMAVIAMGDDIARMVQRAARVSTTRGIDAGR